MYIVLPRTALVTNESYGVWDVVKDDTGGYYTFKTLDEAKQYARDNDLETTNPLYFIVEMVGW
ncbi:hypothetical protein [Psychrobacillus sp. OK032]|uniref:hypothetical protein n=1 Tax=Psychrobacillus sp. OK032 TaxID=1884358 RepID=UPI0008CBFF81|nr:hypothetical protein [Psychrobacillus sp. OK032]SER87563.1 hypothetical protein SAMN05518872_102445 [Psychrobacillus sp. OK032]